MDRKTWSAATDAAEVWARAGGRRRYNKWRQFMARYRRTAVLRLANLYEPGGLWGYGVQAHVARELGVSPSTICRDIKIILRRFHLRDECPGCGSRLLPRGYDT